MKEIRRGAPPHRPVVYEDWTIDPETRRLTHHPTGAVFLPGFAEELEPVCLVVDAGSSGDDLEELGREGGGWFLVFGSFFLMPQPGPLSGDGKY